MLAWYDEIWTQAKSTLQQPVAVVFKERSVVLGCHMLP